MKLRRVSPPADGELVFWSIKSLADCYRLMSDDAGYSNLRGGQPRTFFGVAQLDGGDGCGCTDVRATVSHSRFFDCVEDCISQGESAKCAPHFFEAPNFES